MDDVILRRVWISISMRMRMRMRMRMTGTTMNNMLILRRNVGSVAPTGVVIEYCSISIEHQDIHQNFHGIIEEVAVPQTDDMV